VRWEEPLEESGSIFARLLGRNLGHATVTRFYERFSRAAQEADQEPVTRARQLVQAGRWDSALDCYRAAVGRQPHNWVLLNEIAQFLTSYLQDPRWAVDMAKLALELNPTSAELWATLGDALFAWGLGTEARSAYDRAAQINPHDGRARYGLACAAVQEKDYPEALKRWRSTARGSNASAC